MDVSASIVSTFTAAATATVAACVAAAAIVDAADNDANNGPPEEDFPVGEPMPTTTAPYVIPSLALGEGTVVFTYLGDFLSYITPHDLPALKIESGFICLIALFLLVSLVPLVVLTVWGCAMASSSGVDADTASSAGLEPNNVPPVDSLLTLEESLGTGVHCRRRALQFSLQLVIVMLVICVTAMFVTNEQIVTAINQAPDVIRASLKDMESFLKDAQRQITYNVQDAARSAVERIKEDLDATDKLLGEPIRKEIESHTGIEVAFDSVKAICASNADIIHLITLMHNSIGKAIEICRDATARIDEIETQLAVLKKQCIGRDRPLCETLMLKGFADNQFVITLLKLQTDPAIYKMLTLGEQDINLNVTRNLTTELDSAREHFRLLSDHIKHNTSWARSAIVDQLRPLTAAIQQSNRALATTVSSLIDRVDRAWTVATPWLDGLDDMGATIWSLTLTIAIVVLLITGLLVASLINGCARAENRAGTPFVVAGAAMGCASIALALFSVFGMLLGGHGEVFVCRSLYDRPDFVVLGKLFDRPGLMYVNGSAEQGIIGELLRPGNDSSSPNVQINATLTGALQRCERGAPAFRVFQLDGLMNVSANMDYTTYASLVDAIERLNVSSVPLCSLTDPLQSIVEDMYVIDIDLTAYRNAIDRPAPERDMSTFVEQLQVVATQVQDVGTTSRMSTLASRARRLQTGLLQPLEVVRREIVYHLTALELQRIPWAIQVNQSLLQLKTIQHILNKDAATIFGVKTKEFRNRIKSHLTASREHLLWLLNEHIVSCRPLYQIFEANRLLFCRHTIDPLNGLWFAGLTCILLWVMATPLTLGLASIYRRMTCAKGMRHTNSHQAPTDSLIISEQSNWASSSAQRIHANIDRSNW